jgi:hypothetical protein
MYHGVVHPTYKNLFVLGFGQARSGEFLQRFYKLSDLLIFVFSSGCGPLIYSAATTIVNSMKAQEKLTFPLGRVLQAVGTRFPEPGKNSTDVIIDPYVAFAKVKLGKKLLLSLTFWEKLLFDVKRYDPSKVGIKTKSSKPLPPVKRMSLSAWNFLIDMLGLPMQ